MVILYGSQAKGTATESSDIDIAVVVDRIEGDFLDAEIALFRARRGIDDRIEPVLLEYGNDPSGFLASILGTGQVIYQA
jgi:predicted nucleotidyltransferase